MTLGTKRVAVSRGEGVSLGGACVAVSGGVAVGGAVGGTVAVGIAVGGVTCTIRGVLDGVALGRGLLVAVLVGTAVVTTGVDVAIAVGGCVAEGNGATGVRLIATTPLGVLCLVAVAVGGTGGLPVKAGNRCLLPVPLPWCGRGAACMRAGGQWGIRATARLQ